MRPQAKWYVREVLRSLKSVLKSRWHWKVLAIWLTLCCHLVLGPLQNSDRRKYPSHRQIYNLTEWVKQGRGTKRTREMRKRQLSHMLSRPTSQALIRNSPTFSTSATWRPKGSRQRTRNCPCAASAAGRSL